MLYYFINVQSIKKKGFTKSMKNGHHVWLFHYFILLLLTSICFTDEYRILAAVTQTTLILKGPRASYWCSS